MTNLDFSASITSANTVILQSSFHGSLNLIYEATPLKMGCTTESMMEHCDLPKAENFGETKARSAGRRLGPGPDRVNAMSIPDVMALIVDEVDHFFNHVAPTNKYANVEQSWAVACG